MEDSFRLLCIRRVEGSEGVYGEVLCPSGWLALVAYMEGEFGWTMKVAGTRRKSLRLVTLFIFKIQKLKSSFLVIRSFIIALYIVGCLKYVYQAVKAMDIFLCNYFSQHSFLCSLSFCFVNLFIYFISEHFYCCCCNRNVYHMALWGASIVLLYYLVRFLNVLLL